MTTTIDLRPEIVNVKVTRGDKWLVKVTMTGYDLTGYEILGQYRVTFDAEASGDMLIVASAPDRTTGVFYYGQENAPDTGQYVYDIQLAPSGEPPRTRIKGVLTVDPDVTRD